MKARRNIVTIRSIAEESGVSVGAVSSVLNKRNVERRIPTATAERVLAVASRLGYVPNISARQLRRGLGSQRTLTVALVTSHEAPILLINHFLRALRRAALNKEWTQFRFSLVVEMYSAGGIEKLPGLLSGEFFNAAIITNTIAADDRFLARSHLPYPVVLVNRSIPGYASVIESPITGQRAAELIAKSGCRKPAVLHGQPMTQSTYSRVDGFLLRSSALLGRPATELTASRLDESSGYEAMQKFLRRNEPVDALYTTSDALALGAYRAIREARLKVPDDIAVIGVGDYETAEFFDPPLTCLGVSHAELAEKATELLLGQLRQATLPPPPLVIPPVEVVRASTRGA